MLKKLNNEKGLLLPDLIASLPLGVIVLVVMVLSVANFLTAYSDVRDFTKLQDDLFQAIETLRYGYVQDGINNVQRRPLCGLLTANQVTLSPDGTDLRLKVDSNPAYPIESRFWITSDGMMKLQGGYGSQLFSLPNSSSSQLAIFPRSTRREGRELKYRILNPATALNARVVEENANTHTNMVRLLEVDIKAQVRFRERQDGQTEQDDRRLNTREIRYKTNIFVPNTPSLVS